jgi:hypothetical protein
MSSSDLLDPNLSVDQRTKILVKIIEESIDSKRQEYSSGKLAGPPTLSLDNSSVEKQTFSNSAKTPSSDFCDQRPMSVDTPPTFVKTQSPQLPGPSWAINGDFSEHKFVPRWLRSFWLGDVENIWEGHFGRDSQVGYWDCSLQHSEQSVGGQPAGLSSGPPKAALSEDDQDWIELKELLDSVPPCQEED